MKNKIILFASSLLSIMLISSCDGMNDIHQKYIDEGERVYLGMNDSLTAYPGVERVKLEWYTNANPTMETTVIYWNMRQDSIEIPFVWRGDGIQKDSVFISLPEDTYIFELINKNRRGERSLASTVECVSYGDRYASNLKVRPVTGLSCTGFNPATQSSTIRITWGDVPDGCIESTVTYKKRTTGEEVVLSVDNEETATILTDVGNRLEHPDDIMRFTSLYRPDRCIDLIGGPTQRDQLMLYMASGTRVENTIYNGSNTTFTYTYARQDKNLRMLGSSASRVFTSNRVAERSATIAGTSMRLTLSDDQAVDVSGIYASFHPISNGEGSSSYDPATQTFNLRYRVQTTGGSYTVTETLVPKTTPLEKEVAKPFVDMREVIPGDNNTTIGAPWLFACLYDGILPPTQNGWLTGGDAASTSTSFTFDLKEKVTLTRMNYWQAASNVASHLYGNANVLKWEIWGVAELDESKLSNTAYWADEANPAGTFKEDWEYLGVHEVERLDYRNATGDELYASMLSGDQFILPSVAPVRYLRIYARGGAFAGAYFFAGEFSFFGY